ncbi:response regulator transcription factor [Streptomyces sulphureus]|uniref:response regulator transcription factor n=1 Tax=Streptomyces sulphureus TaxID=47758 RepID=UPI000D0AB143|nr:response regulator transcription factor [Streptomyces sulphureus]
MGHGLPLIPAKSVREVNTAETWTVLVVESQAEDREALAGDLIRCGQKVRSVTSGRAAIDCDLAIDLILLGLELADLDGLEVCRDLRAARDIPIIAIGSQVSELDAVLALRAGADDYVARPYGFRELMARMEAVMRRVGASERTPMVLERGPLRIDVRKRDVVFKNRAIKLTRKEFDLLLLLALNRGTVVSRDEILKQIWGGSWSRRTVDTHISSIRSKLGDRDWIVSIRGVGFMMDHI